MEAAATRALLRKLAEMLADEYKLHKGVKYLQEELQSMQAALEAASQVPPDASPNDGQLKPWARKVRELAYDAEDTIDSYAVRVAAAPKPRSCWAWARRYQARRRIATEIQRIKSEVHEVSERRRRFSIPEAAVAGTARPQHATVDRDRLPVLYENSARLVGMGRSTEELIRLMGQQGDAEMRSKSLSLVSIVGPGGIGKTTLANEVYKKLREKFDCGAFVSVSLSPNMKSVLSYILRQVSLSNSENPKSWGEKELIDRIRDVLEDKRYFIVIDDIWEESVWKHIRCVLVENNSGSKIITTTRNIGVARLCRPTDCIDAIVHKLQPLSIDDSKKLFYRKAFGVEDRCPSEFKDISAKFLRRCDGLPLAIVTVASILSSKQTMDEWSSVYNSVDGRLASSMEDMRRILSLSYYDLQSELKPCSLYLSIFPEDHKIERDDLIWRWIGEGFVHAGQGRNLYEVGEEYFNKLIDRSMMQPVHVDVHGRIQTCRVHDMVLDVITSLSIKENFITTNGTQDPPNNVPRRLYLRNSNDGHTIAPATMNSSHIRTLTMFCRDTDLRLPLLSFRLLRVLDLEDCITQDIGDIENLVHLRYLRISSTHFIEIPKQVANLKFLQTLDLRRSKIKALPSTVIQLKRLVRLCVEKQTQLPDGIGSMESLEELSEVDNINCPNLIQELDRLCKLRVLEISLGKWDRKYKETFLKCLCNMKELQILHIFAPDVSLDFMLGNDWSWTPPHLRSFTACVRRQTGHIFSLSPSSIWSEFSSFSRLPNWIKPSLSNLSYLSIMVNTLPRKDLEVLGSLPALCSLDLHVVKASAKERMEVTSSTSDRAVNFRCLANFKFASRAAGLVFRPGAMQKLQVLSLSFDIAETKYVHRDYYLGLENLTYLKAVDIGIDCRCATSWEVQVAEAVIRTSIKENPNHPSLDLRRHFVREMPWEPMLEIPKLETMTEELTGVTKIGPWGGNGGFHKDINVAPHRLESWTICIIDAVIGSLSFSYYDRDGQQHTGGPWGGCSENEHKIDLEPGTEFLISISGTSGMKGPYHNIITSLTFTTNVRSYGPYGLVRGDHFDIPVQGDGYIVGFFGRAHVHLDAIGVYVNMRDEEAGIAKFGQWGGEEGRPQDIEMSSTHLESVTIYSGGVIDSLAFSYRDQSGQCHIAGPWGGDGGDGNTIQLGHSEFITGVFGTIGPYEEQSELITSLVLVTNACSYGPFGEVRGTSFHIPVKSNGRIVGFFGRADKYVNAIGVYTNHKIEMMQHTAVEMDGQQGIPSRIGPWGGNGGNPRDITVPSYRLENMTIFSDGLVDSLAFSYRDHNGHQHTAGPWGGCGGNDHKIRLDPSEHVVHVSGTIGPWGGFSNVVTTLTLVTNAGTYGPFGQGNGTAFHVPVQSNSRVVGFFVRAGQFIDAIGVDTAPL